MKPFFLATLFFLPALVQAAPPKNIPPGATPREIELGDKTSEQLEKDPKIKLLDPKSSPEAKALLDKLNGMAKELGKASARPDIVYTVKVIEDKDINAFTLPNGKIYMFRGLLDYTSSDDEIAGVIAHEIGHNAQMHALRGSAKAKKLSWVSLAAMAAVLAGGGQNAADLMQFSQYALIGVMNSYGVEYEKEADTAGLEEIKATQYNPSAMVTFMRRLELQEKRRPEVKLGIFQTHPPSEERAAALLAQMKTDGLAFTPRDVEGGQIAKIETKDDRFSVKITDLVILEFAKTPGAEARAQQAAKTINSLLRDNLKAHELSANSKGALMARGFTIATATPADAKLQNLSVEKCAQEWNENFRRLFWREQLNGKF